MNNKDLLRAIGDIDDKFLYEKEIPESKESKVIVMKNSKKIIYAICSMCAVMVMCFGIVNINLKKDDNIELGKNTGGGYVQDEKETLKIELNINDIKELAQADMDARIDMIIERYNSKISESVWQDIQKTFKEKIGISYDDFCSSIPNTLSMSDFYSRSTRGSKDKDLSSKYSVFDYVFEYKNENDGKVTIALCKENKPLRDYYFSEEGSKTSKIGDVEFKVFKYEKLYFTELTHKEINFDIETENISESELVSLINSIINGFNIYSNPNYSKEDKDTGEKEPVNEIVNNNEIKEPKTETTNKKYPESYGGRYVDNNGNNVVWICEDNATNRKEICKFLGITESKTIFKKAQYSYNYLEDLQRKISEKMSNKEFKFITTSALMDSTNRIKVTVTTNNEKELKRIKELDAIGGAIEIEYNANRAIEE